MAIEKEYQFSNHYARLLLCAFCLIDCLYKKNLFYITNRMSRWLRGGFMDLMISRSWLARSGDLQNLARI